MLRTIVLCEGGIAEDHSSKRHMQIVVAIVTIVYVSLTSFVRSVSCLPALNIHLLYKVLSKCCSAMQAGKIITQLIHF